MAVDIDFVVKNYGLVCEFSVRGAVLETWDIERYSEAELARAIKYATDNFVKFHDMRNALDSASRFA